MHRTAMDLMIRFARPALLTLAFHSLASAADFGLATDPPTPSEIKSRDPFGFGFNPLASPETKAAGVSGLVAKPPIPIPPPIRQGPTINAIEIQYAGPAKFARERILGHMTTAVGELYSEQVIERDMRDIYNSGGIYNVRIFGQPCADGVKIIVVVQ